MTGINLDLGLGARYLVIVFPLLEDHWQSLSGVPTSLTLG